MNGHTAYDRKYDHPNRNLWMMKCLKRRTQTKNTKNFLKKVESAGVFGSKIILKRRYTWQIEIFQHYRRVSSNTRLLNGLTLQNVTMFCSLLTRRSKLWFLLSEYFFSKLIKSRINEKKKVFWTERICKCSHPKTRLVLGL